MRTHVSESETVSLPPREQRHGTRLVPPPVQRKENKTGMPDHVKSGIEHLSGLDISDVKVHYNSSQPAQLNAHAYAQGNQIHIAPGQEKYLPHEAWHVVQQKQGRVKPTATLMKTEGTPVNTDVHLEHEADTMGARALQMKQPTTTSPLSMHSAVSPDETIQRQVVQLGVMEKLTSLTAGLVTIPWNLIAKMPQRLLTLLMHIGRGVFGLLKWIVYDSIIAFTGCGAAHAVAPAGGVAPPPPGFCERMGKWIVDGIKGGAVWVIKLISKIIDIAGMSDVLGFLMDVFKPHARPLTAHERALAHGVFGDHIPYWQVHIDDHSLIAKFVRKVSGQEIFITMFNTINCPRPFVYPAENSLLVHEVAHAAQMQQGGMQYMPLATIAQLSQQGYNYALRGNPNTTPFKDFNVEQQGEIARDLHTGGARYGGPAPGAGARANIDHWLSPQARFFET